MSNILAARFRQSDQHGCQPRAPPLTQGRCGYLRSGAPHRGGPAGVPQESPPDPGSSSAAVSGACDATATSVADCGHVAWNVRDRRRSGAARLADLLVIAPNNREPTPGVLIRPRDQGWQLEMVPAEARRRRVYLHGPRISLARGLSHSAGQRQPCRYRNDNIFSFLYRSSYCCRSSRDCAAPTPEDTCPRIRRR